MKRAAPGLELDEHLRDGVSHCGLNLPCDFIPLIATGELFARNSVRSMNGSSMIRNIR